MTVDLRVEVFDDVEALAREAASFVAGHARIAVEDHGLWPGDDAGKHTGQLQCLGEG